MKISEIEYAANKSYDTMGKNLRSSRLCQAKRAREAVIFILYMLGCGMYDICRIYNIPNKSVLSTIIKRVNRRIIGNTCDSDTINFLKEIKELVNGNKI